MFHWKYQEVLATWTTKFLAILKRIILNLDAVYFFNLSVTSLCCIISSLLLLLKQFDVTINKQGCFYCNQLNLNLKNLPMRYYSKSLSLEKLVHSSFLQATQLLKTFFPPSNPSQLALIGCQIRPFLISCTVKTSVSTSASDPHSEELVAFCVIPLFASLFFTGKKPCCYLLHVKISLHILVFSLSNL